ncbi:MAG: hypothetical protein Q9207_001966 [Kuettlingeria erythrocarpa]
MPRHRDSQSAPPSVALDGELGHILPSPSASDIPKKEVSACFVTGELRLIRRLAQLHPPQSKKRKREQDPDPRSSTSRSPDHRPPDLKRERSDELGCSIEEREGRQCTRKRTRLSSQIEAPKDKISIVALPDDQEGPYHPIAHWVTWGIWPQDFYKKGITMGEPAAKKRLRSTSYTQSVKDGDNPRAYTAGYEQVLARANIFMGNYTFPGLRVTAESQRLCKDLQKGNYDLPLDRLYHDNEFTVLLARLRSRNEARVLRDLTPMILPSVEHLDILGCPALSHLTEELGAEWIKCLSIAGPRPKPDRSVGLHSSAFSDEELVKLRSYTAPNRATLFTENMYFPFLMGEVKCGEEALARADRQNMHSSSVALNALVQLFRAIPPTVGEGGKTTLRTQELHRQILAFSISHDNTSVKLYGHYVVIEGDKTSFYRYPILQSDLEFRQDTEHWRYYQFVRSLYADFAPAHLKRVKSAIAQLPTLSGPESEVADDNIQQEGIPASVPSSQDDGVFKRPSLPLSVQLQQDKDRLLEQSKKDKEELEQLKRVQQDKDRLSEQLKRDKEELEQLKRVQQDKDRLSEKDKEELEQLKRVQQDKDRLSEKDKEELEQLKKVQQDKDRLSEKDKEELEQLKKVQQDKDRLSEQLLEQSKTDKEELEQLKKMVKLLVDKGSVTEST